MTRADLAALTIGATIGVSLALLLTVAVERALQALAEAADRYETGIIT